MLFHIIASGSKGNCTVIYNKTTRILIDMGISLVRLKEGLKEINLSLEDIDGIVFTHEHSDHISGYRFLSPKKTYGLYGTLPSSLGNVVELNKEFYIKDFTITPFKTSHDASNPCGYLIKDNKENLVYMTDTGYFVESNLDLIKNPDYLIIESNHDISMLMGSGRPMILKRRILSEVGHLCNEDSAIASCKIIGNKTKEIVLAHLSEECNTPQKALDAYSSIFNHFGVNLNNCTIKVSKQYESIDGGTYEN